MKSSPKYLMLESETFYFGLIRKYIVIMATIFDSINVPRYQSDGVTLDQLIKMPVLVGPRDKTLARLFADPDIIRMAAFTMPRISFELTDMVYDSVRKQSTIETLVVVDPHDPTQELKQYVPVPYDLHFSAYIYSKTAEDGAKVLEQIVPFFAPEFVVRAQLVPKTEFEQNIVINLDRVEGPRDNYADDKAIERRAVVWTLDFTLKGWFYGPIYDIGLIKFVEIRLFAPNVDDLHTANSINSGVFDEITLQPGLLANGQPTTNAAASIPYKQVNLGDDWAPAFLTYGDVNPANT